MASYASWKQAVTDAGAVQFTDQAVALAAPTTTTQGVITSGGVKGVARVWNSVSPLAGGFDVEIWQLYSNDSSEGWFRNEEIGGGTGVVTIGAVSPADRDAIEFDLNGAIRVFVRVLNFAGGATASARVAIGTN